MAITHKSSTKVNLASYQTWVTDTNPTSEYFQLAQIPDTLTAGKNAFLINGSAVLISTTEVLVELVDSQGNAVSVNAIKGFQEGLARIVSLEIYQDTPPGLATLTILGHIAQTTNGETPPERFKNSYNVKWQKTILITPERVNTTPIRFYSTPEMVVSEVLNNHRVSPPSILSGSGGQIRSLKNIVIYSGSTPFVAGMEGGALSGVSNSVPFNTRIVRVHNSTTVQVADELSLLTSNFTASYTGSPSYVTTTYVKSFADISLKKLTTFSGQVYRAKVYVSSIDSPEQEKLLTDAIIQPNELLQVIQSLSGEQNSPIGKFNTESVATLHWIGAPMASMSLYTD